MDPLKIAREAFFFYTRNLIQICILFLPVIIVLMSIQYFIYYNIIEFIPESYINAVWYFATFIFYPFYAAPFVTYIYKLERSEDIYWKELFQSGILFWRPLFIASIIVAFLTGIGVMLLIIPGLWIMSRLFIAEALVVLMKTSPIDAVKQSYNMTKGFAWVVFFTIFIVTIPIVIIDYVLGQITELAPNTIVYVLEASIIEILNLFFHKLHVLSN